jgi:UDP-2,3-diacylglucosamine pyrophosphatase LpxH
MQIAVLSDLHLGEKDKLDQFHRHVGAEQKLYHLLNYLEGHVDKIILLGDIFETLRGRTMNTRTTLVNILQTYPEFTNKILDNDKYELLQGNHDLITVDLLNAKENLIIKDRGQNMCFFHGHQLDPEVADFWTRNFEHFGVWAGGWFARMGLDWTRSMNEMSKQKALRHEWVAAKFEEKAAQLGRAAGCNIVVTGHSHHPMKVEYGDTLYLNSGTRVAARQDLIIIDTAATTYDIYKEFDSDSQHSTY